MPDAWIIGSLIFVTVSAIGAAAIKLLSRRSAAVAARLRGEIEVDSTATYDEANRQQRYVDLLDKVGNAVSMGKSSTTLREHLARAGYHSDNAAAVFIGAKIMLFFVGFMCLTAMVLPTDVSGAIKITLITAGAGLMFFIPNLVVSVNRSRRFTEVQHHLPDAVDLLEICVSSGMGLDMAWNAVAEEVRSVSPVLADEMTLTNLEMHLGALRADAMRHMAERTGCDDLSSLVAVLVQSERFGASISDALRAFATSMREIRSQRAEESAEKMSVKLLFPLIFFIFPAMLIVVAGPAAMKIADVLNSI